MCSHKTGKPKWLAAMAFLIAPMMANASSVTYDFVGSVTSYSSVSDSIPIGTPVTGSFTLDFANSLSNSNTIGESDGVFWQAARQAGSSYGIPATNSFVFSSSINVSGLATYTTTSGYFVNVSTAAGQYDPNNYSVFSAEEYQETSVLSAYDVESGSSLVIGAQNAATPPFSSFGLPILAPGYIGTGSFYDIASSSGEGISVNFVVTSLTPVPVPASAWLMLCGLMGFWLYARRGTSHEHVLADATPPQRIG